ncbi:MAG: SGNH/GDSL hydrolase family protein [Myxococcales bacterium]|nr:SGNH/GDSL hydrolase family protein [Myxococcales bacterium]
MPRAPLAVSPLLLLAAALAQARDAPPAEHYPAGRLLSPLSPGVVDHLRAVAARAPRQDDVFAKVGCSISHSLHFLRCFGAPTVDLGPFEHLRATLDFFRAGDAAGTDPFRRQSRATHRGWRVQHALRGDPSPLDVELDALDPRFAVTMFGTNDTAFGEPAVFARDLWRLVDRLTARGVVPILSTIPPRDDDHRADALVPIYNGLVRGVAQGLRVPLVDLRLALDALPGHGLSADRLHPAALYRAGRPAACDFGPEGLRRGYNVRNLLTLAALHAVKRVLIDGQAPPDPPPAAPTGDGSWYYPVQVGALPFSDLRPAHDRPERVYRLQLDRPALIDAWLVGRHGRPAKVSLVADVRGHAPALATSTERIEASLAAGTWYVVVERLPDAPADEALLVLVERG